MEVNKIMHADMLDIIFEGKNKAYGAYDLRKTYNKRVSLAVTGMAAVCLLFSLSRILANDNGKDRTQIPITVVTLENLKEQKIQPEPPRVQPRKVDPPRVEMRHFATPVIVDDKDVKDPPPAVDDLDKAQIGLANQDGTPDVGLVAPPVEQSTGVIESPKKEVEDYDKTFIKVEKEAMFPGGMEGWKRFLQRNLNAGVAADDGAPAGNYTVKVQFIVDKEGNISNVQAIEIPKVCPGCGPEAVKVIKRGPKWEPAIQNGKKVTYQAVQYITFQVAEQ